MASGGIAVLLTIGDGEEKGLERQIDCREQEH